MARFDAQNATASGGRMGRRGEQVAGGALAALDTARFNLAEHDKNTNLLRGLDAKTKSDAQEFATRRHTADQGLRGHLAQAEASNANTRMMAETTRRGQDLATQRGAEENQTRLAIADQRARQAAAALGVSVARYKTDLDAKNTDALDKELAARYPDDKDGKIKNSRRSMILNSVREASIDWTSVSGADRAWLMDRADRAKTIDEFNTGFWEWAQVKLGMKRPTSRSNNLFNYEPTGMDPGILADDNTAAMGAYASNLDTYGNDSMDWVPQFTPPSLEAQRRNRILRGE
jgi:hypothetical protein